jgi:hypothetical protein
MRNRAAIVVSLLVASGCTEKVYVDVQCVTVEGPAINCELTQKEGKSEVDVCWDFSATCENGAVVTAARTCHKVKDGGKASVTISADKITGVDKCQGSKPPTAKLENLTLNGKASTAK